mmetsp:Transcript_11725/g.16109  ORF Transcript_11725/g.16109 Transcript_11725/m.16109 type:complete len:169 (-) Transcript_11725:179-685(-)
MVTPPNRPVQSSGLIGSGTSNPMLSGSGGLHRRVDSYNAESKSDRVTNFEYGDSENDTLYLTVEAADLAKEQQQSRPLDEDQLGEVEEQLRKMNSLLKTAQTPALLAMNSEFRRLMKSVTHRWPNLRATAVVGKNVDFTLIPRAMQAEEDLIQYLNEFRGLEFASNCT